MLIRRETIWGGTSLISLGFLLLFAAGSGMTQALATEEAAPASLKLARELPADALFYGYFCGTDKVKEDGKGTALAALINDPAFKTPLAPFPMPQGAEGGLPGIFGALRLFETITAKPMYAAVMPGPKVLAVIEAGEKAQEIQKTLEGLFQGGTQAAKPKSAFLGRQQASYLELGEGYSVTWTVHGGRFIVALAKGGAAGEAATAESAPAAVKLIEQWLDGKLSGAANLAGSAKFQKMATRCGYNHAFAVWYADVLGILSQFEPVLPQESKQVFKQMMEASGLSSLAAVAGGLRFDSPGIRQAIFAWFPEGREGVFQLIGEDPIDESMLAKVPKEAWLVQAANLDLLQIYDKMMAISEGMEAGSAERVKKETRDEFGFELRDDFFAPLGNHVLAYLSGDMMGFIPPLVFRWEMRDQQRCKQSIDKLVKRLAESKSEGGPKASMEVENGIYHLRFESKAFGALQRGLSLAETSPPDETAGLDIFSTFDRGDLVLALREEDLAQALKMGNDPQASLLAKEDFVNARRRLPAKGSMLFYEDTAKGLEMYFQQMTSVLGFMGAMTSAGGEPAPSMPPVPPMSPLTRHLFGRVSLIGTEEGGIFCEQYLAIPGASSLPMLVQLPFLGTAMAGASTTADAAICVNNLKQIGLAAHIYSADHNDAFPSGRTGADAITELIASNCLPVSEGDETPVFVCPSAEADLKAWNRTKKLSLASCSYGWVSSLTEDSPADFVLAYDKSPDFHKGFRNVLLVNGNVKHLSEDEFQKKMAEQKAKMGPTRGKVAGGE